MNNFTPGMAFSEILRMDRPDAVAWISGNEENPKLSGKVSFYRTPYEGILVEAEIFGLPNINTPKGSQFYGMHIHEDGNCTRPFDRTGPLYTRSLNMGQQFVPATGEHPQHSGDLLPLMGNQGYAWGAFYDKQFHIPEIVGRSVVIHAMRDDFTTQPAGDSGEKIGCGVIR